MNYPNIKQAKLSHRQIAKAFGYKNVNSFRSSSAHKRHMQGVENILELAIVEKFSMDAKAIAKQYKVSDESFTLPHKAVTVDDLIRRGKGCKKLIDKAKTKPNETI